MSQQKHPLHSFCQQVLQAGILPSIVGHAESAQFNITFTEDAVDLEARGLMVGSHFNDIPAEANTYLAIADLLIEMAVDIIEDPERNHESSTCTSLN